jgi:micrococcal nuclease
VRLAEIDQPFGQRSKQSLSDLCFARDTVLDTTDKVRYGRTVPKVYCGGVYANPEQIRSGMAWAYRKYHHDQSLLGLESQARLDKRGL